MTYYFEAGGNVKRDIINVRSIKIFYTVEVSSLSILFQQLKLTFYILLGPGLFYDISMLSLQSKAFHPTLQLKLKKN